MGEEDVFEDGDELFCSVLETPYDEAEWRNVCDDFLDPLERDVGRLIARFPQNGPSEDDVACWLSDVTTGLAGLGDLGPEAFVERRRRGKIELAMTVSQAFAAEFETRADEIFERANELDDRFQDLTVDQLRGELWKFSHVDLPEFRSFLRHCSLTRRQMLRDASKSDAGSGKAGASGSKPKVKKKRGAPPKYDPKADKQIMDAWDTGRYKNHEELEKELGLEKGAVKRAKDRHRKR